MRKLTCLLLFASFLYLAPVHARDCSLFRHLFLCGVHEVGIGPQWYYVDRRRCSGSEINGNLYGGYVAYDRFRRSSLYWGLFGEVMHGEMDGVSGAGDPVRATAHDWRINGRLGWTFNICAYANPFVTLYSGYGYFEEKLSFKDDCQTIYVSRILYDYVPFGIYFRAQFTCAFWASIRAEALWPTNPRNRISNDPDCSTDATLLVDQRVQWIVELPLEWRCRWGVRVTPFYQRRNYGGREDVPCNFIETYANVGGCRIEVTTSF